MAAPTGSKENWAGNGFYSVKKELKTTAEGARDANQDAGRMWTMVNPNKQHYSSGAPIGYKIMCKDTAPLLPHHDSLVGRRATFAKHTIWTTPYVDGQLFPGGKFPTQTRFAPEDSLEFWMEGERNIANTDVVTWLQFGTTHVPRPEDWPVVRSASPRHPSWLRSRLAPHADALRRVQNHVQAVRVLPRQPCLGRPRCRRQALCSRTGRWQHSHVRRREGMLRRHQALI